MAAIQQQEQAAARPGGADPARLRQFAVMRADESARHSKASLDLTTGPCSVLRPSDPSPCGMALFREQQQFIRNTVELSKRQVDIQNQQIHERLNCGTDIRCASAADARGQERQRGLAAERDRENQRHVAGVFDADMVVPADQLASDEAAGNTAFRLYQVGGANMTEFLAPDAKTIMNTLFHIRFGEE